MAAFKQVALVRAELSTGCFPLFFEFTLFIILAFRMTHRVCAQLFSLNIPVALADMPRVCRWVGLSFEFAKTLVGNHDLASAYNTHKGDKDVVKKPYTTTLFSFPSN